MVSSSSDDDDGAFVGATRSWQAILPPDDLANMPARDDAAYLPFCEKIIEDLTRKVAKAEDMQ